MNDVRFHVRPLMVLIIYAYIFSSTDDDTSDIINTSVHHHHRRQCIHTVYIYTIQNIHILGYNCVVVVCLGVKCSLK